MLIWGAAGCALITFVVHTFVGGKYVARPLLADTRLPKASKWLNYYGWHVTTATIGFLAVAFASLALSPDWDAKRPLLLLLASFTLSLSLLSVAVARKGGIHPLRFPSTSLFATTAFMAAAAAVWS